MTPPSVGAAVQRPRRHTDDPILREIVEGLQLRRKRLHPKFFYDAQGSALFDRICELPEYYLTRTETAILEERVPDLARALGPQVMVIELGSGASRKTRILLDTLEAPATYVPVDISRSHLMEAARALGEGYPDIEILPVCADFTQPFNVPRPSIKPRRTLVFFPGSTIGNFHRAEAIELLRLMGRLAGIDGLLLVGADLRKDPVMLERAYNDSAGITAEFNLNLLARLNRDFGADFDLAGFEHRAPWVAAASHIEMRLASKRGQSVHIGDQTIAFATGESIWTESCHKYDCAEIAAMAADAGLAVREVWMDRERLFSVQLLKVGDSGIPAEQAAT